MASAIDYEDIVPNARGLIRTFSGHNYDFGESIADLIDNSLDAGATKIRILMDFDGANSHVIITDNGQGLAESAIREALRPGTERDYGSEDKGKFGLGLKTASLRHCRRLTVVGRSDPGRRRIAARVLDVDDIEKSNKWRVEVIDPPDSARDLLSDHTGTVVIWEKIGKLMGFKHAWGKHAENRFSALKRELDDHLSMVFHRFLAGEASRRKPLEIWIGNLKLEPWDPFARKEPHTVDLGAHSLPVAGDQGKGLIVYHPYILPTKARFSTQRAFDRHGRNRWNALQGFYVYRADRLIQAGGWSRMRTLDEHTKFARASIDFQRDLDNAFELNVSKNWFKLPDDLREALDEHVEVLLRQAKKAYKPDGPGAASPAVSRAQPRPGENHRGPGATAQAAPGAPREGDRDHTSPRPRAPISAREALEHAARVAGFSEALESIVETLRKRNPEVARDLGW